MVSLSSVEMLEVRPLFGFFFAVEASNAVPRGVGSGWRRWGTLQADNVISLVCRMFGAHVGTGVGSARVKWLFAQ